MGERLTAERLGEIRARLAKKFDAGRLTRLQVAAIAADYSLDVEDLLTHIDALEAEIEEWKTTVCRYDEEVDDLRDQVAKLRAAPAWVGHIDELTAENAKLREEGAALRRRLDAAMVAIARIDGIAQCATLDHNDEEPELSHDEFAAAAQKLSENRQRLIAECRANWGRLTIGQLVDAFRDCSWEEEGSIDFVLKEKAAALDAENAKLREALRRVGDGVAHIGSMTYDRTIEVIADALGNRVEKALGEDPQ
jgi:regulator of replication initiation timing